MTLQNRVVPLLVVVAVALWFGGCGGSPNSPPPQPSQSGQVHADHTHANAAEIAGQLAKLAPEDRAAAEKQKICPVTGEPLGSMGVPPKVSIKEREVFLCCKACEDELKGDPEKYLAKLPK